MRYLPPTALACAALLAPVSAAAQTVEDLQRQILELKAEIDALKAARVADAAATTPAPGQAPATSVAVATPAAAAPALAAATTSPAPAASAPTAAAAPQLASAEPAGAKAWYERLKLRGYTQMRYNAFIDGDDTAPAGQSRLRSVHDGSINEDGGFSLRRARLVLEGNVTNNIALYFQTDFATAVTGQSNGERRESFGQLRDAYVDVFLDQGHEFRVRLGQSKVPFGWENLQSSSNRITLDRSDAINSAMPSERDLGIAVYYTPAHVQAIWDRLEEDGQKLFGNYGAFGLAAYNGQGVNRPEQNRGLAKFAMATWPIELDGLGGGFSGQVLELGGAVMLNNVRPEIRTGGVTDTDFTDNRYGVHAVLYPQPFGLQAEWNWGLAPQYDTGLQEIRSMRASGGYVQFMINAGDFGIGRIMPYGRWQTYRGGWKASTNAPRLETDEIELGVEWQIFDALELTVAYANMKRLEADERRTGRATGDLIRTQVQWNY
ncbi:porin [Altererythrobacter xixiisoli]|uniref:Porin n=1 Tax=Croceibacterium xixiisoli TaxID=1476466 RepID=A0A6I4TQ36_9SPHN|nr:porin [Croceibacterium xixiisoli]MXO97984.1 porin [Croceibacterium xixiisoli]